MENKISLNKVALPNNETLGYRECGTGDHILILIHGNMTSSKHWDLLLENFPDKYKIYAIDLRGFGISSYNNPISSIKDFSEDLKLFVDKLNLKKFSIVGWSLGAAVAMQFTIDYGSYVNKLVLLSGMSIEGFSNLLTFPNAMLPNIMVQSKKDIEKFFLFALGPCETTNKLHLKLMWDSFVYEKNQPSPERYREYLNDMMTQRNLVDVTYALSSFNISHEYNGANYGSGDVDKILVPTLIIHGDRDKIIPLDVAKDNAYAIGKNAQLKILEDCGHSVIIDNLPELIKSLVEFLE